MRNSWIGLLLLCSCYGTFRTARAIEKGKWSLDLNWMMAENENKTYDYFDSPCVVIRRGLGGERDIGVKLFVPGFEFLFFKQFIFEENHEYLPSMGFQLGLGIPSIEGALIFSKDFSFLTPYITLRAAYTGIGVWGINGGIKLTYSEGEPLKESKASILFEVFYGRIERVYLDLLGGSSTEYKYYGFALGAGLHFE